MGFLKKLFQPSASLSIFALLIIGAIFTLVGMFAFNYTMHVTSTEEFCTSCHEMDIPYQTLQQTIHFKNQHGATASCRDCHIPREPVAKMMRKVESARELWGVWTGIIDTEEKYLAHREQMQQREIQRLKANDSQECRNCHDISRMDFEAQPAAAQSAHKKLFQPEKEKTCIDCHQGIAHTLQSEESENEFEL